MKLPKLEDINNEAFLNNAFDKAHNEKLISAARLRRNVHLGFAVTGFVCVVITAFTRQFHMSVLSLFLGTLSLVVMTKYDTQLFFLKVLQLRGEIEHPEEDRKLP
jgi:hypothetical protein